MSATNRGTKRAEFDLYCTPSWATDLILANVGTTIVRAKRIIDAGCGTGAIAERVSKVATGQVMGIEREEHLVEQASARGGFKVYQADFLELPRDEDVDVVIMNPPFVDALAFVEQALAMTKPGGHVISLLRMNWFAPEERREINTTKPAWLHVLSQRPCFTVDKCGEVGSDATEYCWAVWSKPHEGHPWHPYGRWSLLPAPDPAAVSAHRKMLQAIAEKAPAEVKEIWAANRAKRDARKRSAA
ncbi:MAG: hypothetical protein PVSMB8_07410 [Vulcanimicrobiaceae bacterium]